MYSVFGAIRTRFAENGNGVEATYFQLAQTVVDTTGTTDHVHVRNLILSHAYHSSNAHNFNSWCF